MWAGTILSSLAFQICSRLLPTVETGNIQRHLGSLEGCSPGAMETDVPPPNTIRVKLAKVEPGTFGLKLCQRQKNPRVLVSDVAPGSVAAECGLVQKNDSIVRINEVDVTEESVKGVENLLRKIEARTPATFLLQCPDAHRTFLQTIFMPDGTPRTWRVSTPVEETTGIRGYLSSLGKPKDVRDSKGNEYDPTTTECVTHIMNREAVALEKKGEGQQRGKMAEQEPSPKAPRESPKHAQVKNLITGSVTTDILHQKAYQVKTSMCMSVSSNPPRSCLSQSRSEINSVN